MELGGSEMILIFFIALVVLGPDELVRYAVKGGRAVAKLRTQFENFKTMTQEELLKRADTAELKELTELNRDLKNLGNDLQKTTQNYLDTNILKKGVPESHSDSSSDDVVESDAASRPLEVKTEFEIETELLMMRHNKKS